MNDDLYFIKAGKYAYERYADSAEWKNFRGDKMPDWLELPRNIRNNWIHTAKCFLSNGFQNEMLRNEMLKNKGN